MVKIEMDAEPNHTFWGDVTVVLGLLGVFLAGAWGAWGGWEMFNLLVEVLR